MNRKELEASIRKLDDIVEVLMELPGFEAEAENAQYVISLLEEAYRYSEDEWEHDDNECHDMG